MKIAQVTPFYPPVSGGVEVAVEQISKRLIKLGHEVDVYTANTGLPSGEVRDGVRIQRFPTILEIGNFARLWPGFLGPLKRGNYDVVHTHVYRHPHSTIVGLYAKVSGKKAFLSTHGPFHPKSVWGKLAPAVRLYDILFGRALTVFDKVLVLDEKEKGIVQRMHLSADKIEVLGNGLDNLHFRKYDPTPYLSMHKIEDSFLYYVGRLHPTKGLEFLLASFAKIDLGGRNRLIISGSGEETYVKTLISLAAKLGIGDKVKFTGYISELDKMYLLEGCRGLVLPSVYEPYGIVLLEAMAHGKPVIATYPRGSNFVVDNHNGFLVRYGDQDGLADRMSQLFSAKESTRHLGRNGYKLASQRTWDQIVDRLEDLYRERRC